MPRKLFESYSANSIINPYSIDISVPSVPFPKSGAPSNRKSSKRNQMRKSLNKVLIVDDDIELMDAIKETVRDYHWPLMFASSSLDALKLLQTKTFDALILDWDLPDCNADTFLQMTDSLYRDHMKKYHYTFNLKTPVITFSADSNIDSSDISGAFFYRAGHWQKPITMNTIKEELNKLIHTRGNI